MRERGIPGSPITLSKRSFRKKKNGNGIRFGRARKCEWARRERPFKRRKKGRGTVAEGDRFSRRSIYSLAEETPWRIRPVHLARRADFLRIDARLGREKKPRRLRAARTVKSSWLGINCPEVDGPMWQRRCSRAGSPSWQPPGRETDV